MGVFASAMAAMPVRLRGPFAFFVGTAFASGLWLSIPGVQAPLSRLMDAYAKRIERSVGQLETAASDIKGLVDRLETAERSQKELGVKGEETRAKLESLSAKVDENARRITILETKPRPVR